MTLLTTLQKLAQMCKHASILPKRQRVWQGKSITAYRRALDRP